MDGAVNDAVLDAFLRRLGRSALAAACVLRGSQLTAAWVPGRVAKDLDFVVEGAWTVATLSDAARALLALPDPTPLDARLEPIWVETPWPGLRLHLDGPDGGLQVDLAFAEPLALPTVPFSLRGVALRSCGPEMMLAWKIHSLVERGPRGRWHAKTLADLVLLDRHLTLDRTRVKACVDVAFAARQMVPAQQLEGFLTDPTWGLSRGSRNKWKSYGKKSPWVDFTLPEAIDRARTIVRAVLQPT